MQRRDRFGAVVPDLLASLPTGPLADDVEPAVAAGTTVQRACARLDRWIGLATELPAALLVVAEIVVLFTGVVFRYGIERPLVWTDELAAALFLWLRMLGSVVAQRRAAHMRLTAIAVRLPSGWRNRLETLAAAVAALFMLEIIVPAAQYASDQAMITTPALGILDWYRASAIVVGAVLMLTVALLQMVQRATLRDLAICLPAILACGLGLWLAQPMLEESAT